MSDTGNDGIYSRDTNLNAVRPSTLEQRYRRALRWYPSAWRAANEEAVLGTLLDAADDSPDKSAINSHAQIANLRVQAIALRVGMLLPDVARHAVASHALAAGTGLAMVYFWFHSRTPLTPSYEDYGVPAWFGPFQNTGVILTALWVGAFVAAMVGTTRTSGHRRTLAQRSTRVVLALTLIATIALPIAYAIGGAGWAAPATTNLVLLGALAALSLLGTPSSRIRLAITTALWVVAPIAVYAINGWSVVSDDRYLWRVLVADIPFELIAIPLLIVAVLARVFVGRVGVAVVLLSASPWLLAWTVVISTEGNLADLSLVAAGTLATGAVLLLALRLIDRSGVRVAVSRAALDSRRIE